MSSAEPRDCEEIHKFYAFDFQRCINLSMMAIVKLPSNVWIFRETSLHSVSLDEIPKPTSISFSLSRDSVETEKQNSVANVIFFTLTHWIESPRDGNDRKQLITKKAYFSRTKRNPPETIFYHFTSSHSRRNFSPWWNCFSVSLRELRVRNGFRHDNKSIVACFDWVKRKISRPSLDLVELETSSWHDE